MSLATLLLASCGGDSPPTAGRPPAEVAVVTLATEPVPWTRELPGRTRGTLVAEVRPQVDGIIQKQLFQEGSEVRAGQALYQIDDALYRADLNSAKADLARAQATLAAARQRARRSDELMRQKLISSQEDEANTAALGEAEAEVLAAQAAVGARQITVNYARIVAPISGRIGRSSVTQGALVTANQAAALATVQQLDPIDIDLAQSSAEWLQLQRELAAGQLQQEERMKVRILMEDGQDYPHAGELKFTEVSVDPSTGSYLLRVRAPNPEKLLLPGMYVRAVLDLGIRPQGLLAPQQGITRDPKGNALAMIVNGENQVEVRAVKTRGTVGDRWLIEEGLQAGDRVIVEGLQKIAPGASVKAVERAATGGKAR